MPADLLVKRIGSTLLPFDGLAEEEIRALPAGKPLRVTVTRSRSVPQNRLYWSMLNLVTQNVEHELSVEALHKFLKLRCGIVEPIILKSGKIEYVDASTAFDKMSPEDFKKYFDEAVGFVVSQIIPGLGRKELIAMAEEMLGTKQ